MVVRRGDRNWGLGRARGPSFHLSDRFHYKSGVLWQIFLGSVESRRQSTGAAGSGDSGHRRIDLRLNGPLRIQSDSRARHPEAMEQILTNRSRIPARLTFLKPLSAAVAIGTGGPFGAEGPIIATGGRPGSIVGQFFRTTAAERKTLLAAGAAAGMAGIFGSPVAAVAAGNRTSVVRVSALVRSSRWRWPAPRRLASESLSKERILYFRCPMSRAPSMGGHGVLYGAGRCDGV